MKPISLILVSLAGIASCSQQFLQADPVETAFKSYIQTFNRSYKEGSEDYKLAFARFTRSYMEIISHNMDKEATFEMDLNEFSDMLPINFESSQLEFKGDSLDMKHELSLPLEVDWSKTQYVSSPIDLANCREGGHIFSAVSALESAFAIRDGLNMSRSENLISVRYFMDCDFSNMGCNGGGMPGRVWQFAAKYGYVMWDEYTRNEPWYTKTSMNVYRCPKYQIKEAFKYEKDLKSITLRDPAIDTIKAILQYQPVVAGIFISGTSPIFQYKSGVMTDPSFACSSDYNDPEKYINNYFITIVGYKEDLTVPGCSGYWIAKNNWGPYWGEQGYLRICIAADDAQYPYGICNV